MAAVRSVLVRVVARTKSGTGRVDTSGGSTSETSASGRGGGGGGTVGTMVQVSGNGGRVGSLANKLRGRVLERLTSGGAGDGQKTHDRW